MISMDTPDGTKVWSCDWARAWHANLTFATRTQAVFRVGDDVRVVPLEKCFLTRKEVYEHLAQEAFKAAQTAMQSSVAHLAEAGKPEEETA